MTYVFDEHWHCTPSSTQCVDGGTGESDDDEDGLCEYEKQRLRKIKENRAFLASLNLAAAKEDLKAITKKQVKVRIHVYFGR